MYEYTNPKVIILILIFELIILIHLYKYWILRLDIYISSFLLPCLVFQINKTKY